MLVRHTTTNPQHYKKIQKPLIKPPLPPFAKPQKQSHTSPTKAYILSFRYACFNYQPPN
ncbi:hypothetical protein CP01DC11_1380 [Chlamydia psittaci 01DC11]|nr:hypothetical protein CP01DC11_1380 [Chlamydia psittaci 01DC11]